MTGRVGPPFDPAAFRARHRADVIARAAEVKAHQAETDEWFDNCGLRSGDFCADDLAAKHLAGYDIEPAAMRELEAWLAKVHDLERQTARADRPRASDARALAAARKHVAAFAQLIDDLTPQHKLQPHERFPA